MCSKSNQILISSLTYGDEVPTSAGITSRYQLPTVDKGPHRHASCCLLDLVQLNLNRVQVPNIVTENDSKRYNCILTGNITQNVLLLQLLANALKAITCCSNSEFAVILRLAGSYLMDYISRILIKQKSNVYSLVTFNPSPIHTLRYPSLDGIKLIFYACGLCIHSKL